MATAVSCMSHFFFTFFEDPAERRLLKRDGLLDEPLVDDALFIDARFFDEPLPLLDEGLLRGESKCFSFFCVFCCGSGVNIKEVNILFEFFSLAIHDCSCR